ncbi:MAG: bacillithiol biosynthesis BshC, partial [Gemmatimonadetes bacterium]|nr:bacillithiol biosynthesis BshC [Gemmatimonadota bacterium]
RESVEELRRSVEERMDAVANAQQARRLVSQEVIDGARAQMRHRIERLERRLRAAATRAEEDAVRDLGSVRAALVPQGERQERRLNFVPLLARHGDPLLAQLKAGAAMHAGMVIGTR